MSPGLPNGETRWVARPIIPSQDGKQTEGTETSQYLEERTSTETPRVVASESGPGQWHERKNRNRLERRARAGDSPVRVEKIGRAHV